MDERVPISLDRVEQCIAALGSSSFTTAQVIHGYLGHFCSDRQTLPVYSVNAQFGKLLARNAARLGIVMTAAEVGTRDDHDHPTTTTRWRRTATTDVAADASVPT